MGVLGFPHFASTLLVPLAWEPLQPYVHAPQPLWLRDRDEKQACVNALTGPHTDRADGVSAIVGDRSRHLLFSPLTRGDQIIGSLLLGSSEGGFRAHHVELCRVLARAAACALRNITRATVFDEHGKTHVVDCFERAEIPTTATSPAPAAGDLPTGPASPHLTGRQRDILWSLFAGKSNAQIAEDLTLSVHTVRTHRRHLLTAFDAHSSAELLAKARAAGVAPLT
ncbi:helix-turn-helix transcriptional regulator [Micrococcales bacterium 31B]|nr:helix-turn-helix transcriptional regulator [Micrococcales bacterium 31B]